MFKADKGHLHHRLMARGYTQKQSVLILYGATATLGMTAIILLDSGIWKAASFALLVIAIVAIGYKDFVKLSVFKDYENKKITRQKEEKIISSENEKIEENQKIKEESDIKNRTEAKFKERKEENDKK